MSRLAGRCSAPEATARGRDGNRLFLPVVDWPGYVGEAFAGGLEVLTALAGIGDPGRRLRRIAWQHYARLAAGTAALGNQLHRRGSLTCGRFHDEADVLPTDLRDLLDSRKQQGSRIQTLLELGREEAARRNLSCPDDHLVWLGMHAAARLLTHPDDPVLTPGCVRRRVGGALFADLLDLDRPEHLGLTAEVNDRYVRCLRGPVWSERPGPQDPDERFRRLVGDKSGLARQPPG